eukprot:358479-Chlamydomonas_euryale.AAC.2
MLPTVRRKKGSGLRLPTSHKDGHDAAGAGASLPQEPEPHAPGIPHTVSMAMPSSWAVLKRMRKHAPEMQSQVRLLRMWTGSRTPCCARP